MTSRIRFWGNPTKVTRFFSSLALLVGLSLSLALSVVGDVKAAVAYEWTNDATITFIESERPKNQKDIRINFVDSNPLDRIREFKLQGPSYCKSGAIDTITLSWPTVGTFFNVTTPAPGGRASGVKIDCKTETVTIAITHPEKAGIWSTPCTGNAIAEQKCYDKRAADGANGAWGPSCNSAAGATAAPGSLCDPALEKTKPPIGANPDDPTVTNEDGKPPSPCDTLGDFKLRWVACPLLTGAATLASGLDSLIADLLHYDTDIFNRDTDGGQRFYKAWSTFRSLALGLVLLTGLIMVVSQGTGLQLFDAYMVRKILPRLLVAVIGISLSWPILQFVITFFNDTGHWAQSAILMPFQEAATDTSSDSSAITSGIGALLEIILGGGAAFVALAPLGPIGLLSLLGTVALALFVGWLVLAIRSVIITVVIIFAPIAIACYILPGTKKIFDFWQNAGTTMLMVFPIIMAFLAAGKALSLVADNGIMKILFFVAPYFFIPFAFKLAGGLMSTVFSLVNDRHKGAFDRMSKFRDEEKKRRIDNAVKGKSNNILDKSGLAGVYRRRALSRTGDVQGAPFSAKRRASYRAAERHLLRQTRDEMLKRDNGAVAGDDEATSLAIQPNASRKTFIEGMMADKVDAKTGKVTKGLTRQAAEDRLADLETSFGAEIGTKAMANAAFHARTASNTAYKGDAGLQELFRDGRSLMKRGVINSSDATAALKSNKARADNSGIGFNAGIAAFERAFASEGDANGNFLTQADIDILRHEALHGSAPGAIVGGRHEGVEALAPYMVKELQAALSARESYVPPAGHTAEKIAEDKQALEDAVDGKLVSLAGIYDAMGQANEIGREKMAPVLSTQVGTVRGADGTDEPITVRKMMEDRRFHSEGFLNRRREMANAHLTEAAAFWAAQQQTRPNTPVDYITPPGG